MGDSEEKLKILLGIGRGGWTQPAIINGILDRSERAMEIGVTIEFELRMAPTDGKSSGRNSAIRARRVMTGG